MWSPSAGLSTQSVMAGLCQRMEMGAYPFGGHLGVRFHPSYSLEMLVLSHHMSKEQRVQIAEH